MKKNKLELCEVKAELPSFYHDGCSNTWRDIKTDATIMFSHLNSHFTFSPRSPISPCWERKQSIKDRKARGELGSVGELLQRLRVRLDLGLNSC